MNKKLEHGIARLTDIINGIGDLDAFHVVLNS